jgi:hypothetical protein
MPIDYDPSRAALYTPEQRETVFVRGQTYTSLQLAVEAARLAYYRADASPQERSRLTEALTRVDFSSPELFVHAPTGTEAYGALRESDGVALIAFRGTQPDSIEDLLTDARAHFGPWPEAGGRVHAGFAAAARAVLPSVRQWLAVNGPADLILTGHSLGAALATIAASVLEPTLLVTLGSPRVGDEAFVRSVTCAATRLVNCCDLVTELPPPLGGYTHAGELLYITRAGDCLPTPKRGTRARDRLLARLAYPWRYARRRGHVLARDLADHAPINYARAVF